jgi:FixJ family two-component response regulator
MPDWHSVLQGTPVIAVLDDEANMRQALGRLLLSHGYQAAPFADADALLAAQAKRPFACVLLDLHMPHSHGFAVLQALQNLRCPTPIIVMTGRDEPGTQTRVMEAGACAYLRKPVEESLLLETIRRQLSLEPGGPSC